MSSGFISAGTNEQPIERDDEWLIAQRELEEERRRKAEIGKQNDGKSLFEVLERNKMAKQEAFEEKSRLKNQFRSLDEDEVEFLDSVLESTRAQEAAVKRDTAAQLEVFRRQREEAEKALLEQASSDPNPVKLQTWAAPTRKRRRDKQRNLLIPGKKRRSSVSETLLEQGTHNRQDSPVQRGEGISSTIKSDEETSKSNQPKPAASVTAPAISDPTMQPRVATDTENGSQKTNPLTSPLVSLGLGGYDSDSD
ncbi:hypothetical protein N7457_000814 [Penicillium paradoxum]|uniref:uncharacterized protein n=1 Tax=Penicillium paradoxum TaxID=176176 RepID=UPI002548BBC2|nr:uncharacterized protein N7457_000814 [Penicillium paradoxum]KAJ5794215.1 hypothetical protein N7457_000814 [Penicillium paradoxum]